MPQDWEQGNAARDIYTNPYRPVNYRQRLNAAPKRSDDPLMPSPYGVDPFPADMPYAASAPQPSEWTPAGPLTPGTPYGAQTYPLEGAYYPEPYSPAWPYEADAGQPSIYPEADPRESEAPSWGDSPFLNDPSEAVYQPEFSYPPETAYQPDAVYQPQAPYPSETLYRPEAEWKDPFTPARTYVDEPSHAVPPPEAPVRTRREVRPARLAAICAAALMLVFCLLVGGRTILDIAANEREMTQLRQSHRELTGEELHNSAARVDLLPAGQTYEPTASPTPTIFAATPVPSPIIPINEAAIASLNGREAVETTAQPQQAVPARARLTSYPKNPLRNVQESLAGLLAQNGDVVGRLVIPDVLDEVVFQRNNTYYLSHTLLGTTNDAGSVFADESCSLRMPPENLLLRGISSVPGKVFNPLWQFISGGSSFAAGHTTAQLTTLYEDERYFLIAVLVAGSDPREANYFNFASQPTFTTNDAMLSYVDSLRQHSLYAFGVDVQASDRLLTLATLGDDNSLVLVYRMAREGE